MTAPTRSHLLTLLTAAAVTAGLLAGCTGGTPAPQPTTSVTGTGAPSPSASPTPSLVAEAPRWTDTMDQVSLDGALAVGQYFLELYPYVIETGDTTEWDRLSHPDCLYCADVSAYVHDDPALTAAPELQVSVTSAQEIDPGVLFSLQFDYRETYDDGSVKPFTALVAVVRESDRWLIRGVQLDPVTS